MTPSGFFPVSKLVGENKIYDGISFDDSIIETGLRFPCMRVVFSELCFSGAFSTKLRTSVGWIKMEDLRIGSLIKIRVGFKLPGIEHPNLYKLPKLGNKVKNFRTINYDIAFILGFFASNLWRRMDGLIVPTYPDDAYRDEFLYKMDNCLGIKPTPRGRFYSESLTGIIRSFGFSGENKLFPWFIFQGSNEAGEGFYDSLIRAGVYCDVIKNALNILSLTTNKKYDINKWIEVPITKIDYLGYQDTFYIYHNSGWSMAGYCLIIKNN